MREPAEGPALTNHSIFYQLDILAKDGLTPIFLGDHQGAIAEMPGTKLGGLLTIPFLQQMNNLFMLFQGFDRNRIAGFGPFEEIHQEVGD